MTVIAWDGRFLVADRLANCNDYAYTVDKLDHYPQYELVLGITGELDRFQALKDWYLAGRHERKDYPFLDTKDSGWGRLIVVHEGKLSWYECGSYGITTSDKHMAFGSGRDFALTALHLEYSALEAVRITSQLSTACGKGLQVYDSKENTMRYED